MKNTVLLFPLALLLILGCNKQETDDNTGQEKPIYSVDSVRDANDYTYITVKGDPLNARIYTLKNGLKVYMTDYEDAPRVQTYIAVGAGSKNDPADATGLAHYLEHMVFKGTTKLGTTDYEKEQQQLNRIEQLYEQYRKTTDTEERKRLYKKIDSVSGYAATFAIANEYDKSMASLGAQGTNAYTSFEQTVYVNDIPANQLERWAMVEAERFSTMVPRLFHTELEAVYEEKNRTLDNDQSKVFETLFANLFPTNNYGTQTTIGTIEHLKNPSITEIKKYFDTYYVPNNMAICLSGDIDMDATIKTIDKYFGGMEPKAVPEYSPAKEQPIQGPVVKEVKGPDAESVMIGFRFPEAYTDDAMKLQMLDMLLNNSAAGLFDINLNQKQKVLGAYSFAYDLKDYSMHVMGARPREGQSLDEVRDLLLAQIDSIKQGNFPDWMMEAIINDFKKSQMQSLESNSARADAFVTAFVNDVPWELYLQDIDRMRKITKEEMVQFAKDNYKDNYVMVKKLTGKDPNAQKVEKPIITPVSVNREEKSPFFVQISEMKADEIEPVFVDYDKDIERSKFGPEVEVLYRRNEENEIFKLYYILDMGKNNDPKLGLAVDYLEYLGNEKYSAEEFQKELYKLGCDFSVFSSGDRVYVHLSGLNENFEPALALFEGLLSNPVPDQDAYTSMVDGILKERADAKLSKNTILRGGMLNYAMYGPVNPFTNIIPEQELRSMNPSELTEKVKELLSYQHRVLYYGPKPLNELVEVLDAKHNVPGQLKPVPAEKNFEQKPMAEPVVYWIDYDMVQAEMMFISRSEKYDPALVPPATFYNEYFGGGMGSLVFQELRESKALAYSTYSYYDLAPKKDRHNYNISYIGAQADKLGDAMAGMEELLNDMPRSEAVFANAKQSVLKGIETNRITKSSILFDYEDAKKKGLDHDIRKEIYQQGKDMDLARLQEFQSKHVQGQPKNILVIGAKDRLDFNTLKKYGQLKQLSLEEVFGY